MMRLWRCLAVLGVFRGPAALADELDVDVEPVVLLAQAREVDRLRRVGTNGGLFTEHLEPVPAADGRADRRRQRGLVQSVEVLRFERLFLFLLEQRPELSHGVISEPRVSVGRGFHAKREKRSECVAVRHTFLSRVRGAGLGWAARGWGLVSYAAPMSE
jgi:hypothetical protein